jgi:hypothetical protein
MPKNLNRDGTIKFRLEPTYEYNPQKDISIEELSLIIPFLIKMNGFIIEELPESLKRHFLLIE